MSTTAAILPALEPAAPFSFGIGAVGVAVVAAVMLWDHRAERRGAEARERPLIGLLMLVVLVAGVVFVLGFPDWIDVISTPTGPVLPPAGVAR